MAGKIEEAAFSAVANSALHDHQVEVVEAKGSDAHPVQTTLISPPAYDFKTGGPIEFIPPTEEERITLRRVPAAIPYQAYLIALCELSERFSYYGCVQVFQNFIQYSLPERSRVGAGGAHGQSGALGYGQQAATGLTTFNSFWVYTTPLFGAYIADKYWGRYKTICVAVAVAIVGHILLVISALPEVLEKPRSAIGIFSVAIVIMGMGTGAFKSNISPLIAEQVKTTNQSVVTLASGERVIVDPTLTTARIFNYFYLFVNIGALIGQLGMTFAEKYVGFWLAYTLPTIVFLLNPLVLWVAKDKYIKTPPSGSVLAESLRLWRFAASKRWSWNPVRCVRQMNAPDFWEDAKPSKQTAESKPRWMNSFDDLWVDEVRRGFKACGVFLYFPLYWLCYNQINNNLTSQAATMQVHGLPNEITAQLDPFALIILIPVCDLLIYPALRKAKINFSALKRICLGFFVGSAAMIYAAVVQHYIYKTSPCGDHAGGDGCDPSPLNVWVQTGSYILIAISEIFASITGLEYAFTKAPRNMRSLVMAIFLFQSAIASAIGEAFNPLSADPNLVINYGVFAGLSALGGTLFWIQFRHLDKQEDDLNNLTAEDGPTGRRIEPPTNATTAEPTNVHAHTTTTEK